MREFHYTAVYHSKDLDMDCAEFYKWNFHIGEWEQYHATVRPYSGVVADPPFAVVDPALRPPPGLTHPGQEKDWDWGLDWSWDTIKEIEVSEEDWNWDWEGEAELKALEELVE